MGWLQFTPAVGDLPKRVAHSPFLSGDKNTKRQVRPLEHIAFIRGDGMLGVCETTSDIQCVRNARPESYSIAIRSTSSSVMSRWSDRRASKVWLPSRASLGQLAGSRTPVWYQRGGSLPISDHKLLKNNELYTNYSLTSNRSRNSIIRSRHSNLCKERRGSTEFDLLDDSLGPPSLTRHCNAPSNLELRRRFFFCHFTRTPGTCCSRSSPTARVGLRLAGRDQLPGQRSSVVGATC